MKFSVKFQEEKSPLVRAKVPFMLGPIPVISGIAVGTKQDLALQFATRFAFGPIIKLVFKPHDLNALSLVLKSGLRPWGCPIDSPVMLAAAICLSPKRHDHYFSLRVEPRFGDFGIRKKIKNVSLLPAQQKELKAASTPLSAHESGEENRTILPQKVENVFLSNSLSDQAGNAGFQKINGNAFEEQVDTSPVHCSNGATGSNASIVEDVGNRSHEHKSRLERVDEAGGETEMFGMDNGPIALMPHESIRKSRSNSITSFSLASAQDAFRGCKIVTHSSLPVGGHSRVNIRWGADANYDFVQGWDGSLPSLCLSKLPSLVFEKLSFEYVASHTEKSVLGNGVIESSEHVLFATPSIEENRELAQVAALCHMMKRQLHLMHAENQVLKRAMEDMKFHVDSTSSSWISNGKLGDSRSKLRAPQTSSHLDGSAPSCLGCEDGNRDVKTQKGKKLIPKREEVSSTSLSNGSISDSVSKELEKAILDAQAGSIAGKKVK